MSNKDIVLVIDDDRIDREILKNILSKDFYVVDYQDAQEGSFVVIFFFILLENRHF